MPHPSDTGFDELPLGAKRRIDAVCCRFEEAWRDGRPDLSAFLEEAAEGERPVLLAELLHIDVERRRRSAEQPAAADYLGRFPAFAGVIHTVLSAAANGRPPDGPTQPDFGPPPAPPPAPVRVPGYEVLEEIGRGGMGVVYRARHLPLNRLVALKFILAGGAAPARRREGFRREAEVVARLRHPNIVQIYDVGEVDGQKFLALEYAEGGSLRDRLDGAPLEPWGAVLLLEPLARAVQHAHRQGVIHRDLKPANILLVPGGDSVANTNRPLPAWHPPAETPAAGEPLPVLSACTPKLADFGLAQLFDEDRPPNAVAGTPSYMAPEQAGAGPVGPAADVWALGASLYELLTGRPPFRAASTAETLRLVRTAEVVPPSQLQPSVPRDLDTICLKCLQKDPALRYPGARELAQDLRRFLSGEAILARPEGRARRAWKWARRRPLAAALALLLLLGALAGCAAAAAALADARAGQRAARAEAQEARREHELLRQELEAARARPPAGGDEDEEAFDTADPPAPGADAGVLARLAWRQARRGRLREAAQLYASAGGALYASDRRRYALVRLAAGDRDGYARVARDEVERCRSGKVGPREARAALWLGCAGPGGLGELEAALALARQGAANAPPGQRQAAQRVLGGALYRAGRWPGALEALRQAGAEDAAACALRAMAGLQAGKGEEARADRAAMRRARAAKGPFSADRLEADLLCEEAEKLFEARGE
jgi:hypothetical protein